MPARAADAVLLGAVGGPKWDTTDPGAPRPEQGLLPACAREWASTPTCARVRPSPARWSPASAPLREERDFRHRPTGG